MGFRVWFFKAHLFRPAEMRIHAGAGRRYISSLRRLPPGVWGLGFGVEGLGLRASALSLG